MNNRNMVLSGISMVSACSAVIFLTGCAGVNPGSVQEQRRQSTQERTQQEAVEAKQERGSGTQQRMRNGNAAMRHEADEVCAGRAENDTCGMTITDAEGSSQTINGACRMRPNDTEGLTCMPEHMQERSRGGFGQLQE